MKLTFVMLLLLGAVSFAAADDKATEKKAPSAADKAKETTIPKDAVEIAPHTYRYRDSNGKVWIYSQSPFGISRKEDVPLSPEEAKKNQEAKDKLLEGITAVERGESVRFTRGSPFGPFVWVKKKTDLNETEQAVWQRELAKQAAAGAASKD